MISATEVKEAMVALDSRYIEKTGEFPNCGAHMRLHSGDSGWECSLWIKSCTLPNYEIKGTGETPLEAIDALRSEIDNLPSEEERNLREFQHDLGKLIDKGRDFGIDVEFVNPLVETSKRLAENALTDQRAAQ
jgi:hypothetical protein